MDIAQSVDEAFGRTYVTVLEELMSQEAARPCAAPPPPSRTLEEG